MITTIQNMKVELFSMTESLKIKWPKNKMIISMKDKKLLSMSEFKIKFKHL